MAPAVPQTAHPVPSPGSLPDSPTTSMMASSQASQTASLPFQNLTSESTVRDAAASKALLLTLEDAIKYESPAARVPESSSVFVRVPPLKLIHTTQFDRLLAIEAPFVISSHLLLDEPSPYALMNSPGPDVGDGSGTAVGTGIGMAVGAGIGTAVGAGSGTTVGAGIGSAVGAGIGSAVGVGSGMDDGAGSGTVVGGGSGTDVGAEIGSAVGGGTGTDVGTEIGVVVVDGSTQVDDVISHG